MSIAILGGGISGLTLAWQLQKAGVAYDLFEAEATPGGCLRTLHHPAGYTLETGPNSLQLSDELLALLTELDLTDAIQDAAPVSKHRYVLRAGRIRELPGSPPALLTSSFFSLKAKFNLLRELTRPVAPLDPQETVAAFFRRRFGPELVDYAVNPFISGIYAGDPEQLLIHKTFAKVAALEQAHGSVLRGLAKSGGGAGRRRIITLRGGLQTLTDALAARLTHRHVGQPARALFRTPNGRYQVQTAGLNDGFSYDAVVLALPTYAAAPLLQTLFPAAAAALAAVRYPPMAAIYTAYQRADVGHPLNGFGALSPKVEQPYAAGTIWTSSLFPDRAPAGQVLFTSFVGGTQYQDHARQPEAAQKAAVHEELSRLYQVRAGAQPVWQFRYFWEQAIPQFDQHIVAAHEAADALQTQGIWSAANWRGGVGVPDCIRHAQHVAAELIG